LSISPPRIELLSKLVTALRPGGWLLVEDVDASGWLHMPVEQLLCEPKRLRGALHASWVASAHVGATAGYDGQFGRDLPVHLLDAGLDEVGGESRSPLIVGGTSGAAFCTLGWRQVGPVLVDSGLMSQRELADLMAAYGKPGAMAFPLTMVSAWGRRP
jgi:hypothetical protein